MEHVFALFSWQDNAFIDLWSIVHIFWGSILGLICIHKKYRFSPSLLVSTILIVLWEYGEYIWGISELWTNIGTDIVLGIIGFIIGFVLPRKLKVDAYIILIPLVIVVIVLEYIGWINYIAR